MLSGPSLLMLLVAAIAFIILANVKAKLHIFLVLLLASYIVGIVAGLGPVNTVNTIAEGFGGTLKSIGIVILLGCIIAVILERAGAISVMADAVLGLVGKTRSVLATSLMGYVISIPVFCDSGFVILSPLSKAMAKRTSASAVTYGVALSTGLYATHCLVPPTPGPVAAAGQLNAELGLVIPLGLLVSIPAVIAGLWYANWIGKRIYVEPKSETGDDSSRVGIREGQPSPLRSFLPIVVPIILICLGSIGNIVLERGSLLEFLSFIGSPITALFVGVGLALTLVPLKKEVLTGWIESGLIMAAVIIFITGAGGAFGKVLGASGIGDYLGEILASYSVWLFLPFAVSALLKTAQGSSTVAMVTTPAIIGPMLPEMGLTSPVALALVVLAIGAGAMVVSHANDSYFWVVTRFTGIEDVTIGYKTQTMATFLEGMAAITAIMVLGAILL